MKIFSNREKEIQFSFVNLRMETVRDLMKAEHLEIFGVEMVNLNELIFKTEFWNEGKWISEFCKSWKRYWKGSDEEKRGEMFWNEFWKQLN